MIEKTDNLIQQSEATASAKPLCHAPVTIFALPKPFVGDADRIQSNAFRSWMQLSPTVDVLLLGDETGIADFAAEHQIAHFGHVDRNRNGTPLVSDAFSLAHQISTSPILVYCNSDVILDHSFALAMESLSSQNQFEQWLAIGQRTDVAIDRELNFADADQLRWLNEKSRADGKKSSHVCKEYFAFSRSLYQDVPPFAVGRGNWDNWMVHDAKCKSIPVVSLTDSVLAVHQENESSHRGRCRYRNYVSGPEARNNQRLAGGRHLIRGSTSTQRLNRGKLQACRWHWLGCEFWFDFPRFARLLANFVGK